VVEKNETSKGLIFVLLQRIENPEQFEKDGLIMAITSIKERLAELENSKSKDEIYEKTREVFLNNI